MSILSSTISKTSSMHDEVFAIDLQDLVLLEGRTKDVEEEILKVDDTLDEVEVLGNEIKGMSGHSGGE